jgi:tRNA dimethylallyltransferase
MNYKRVIHAVEICRQTNLPFSSFRKNETKKRRFRICKIGLLRERTDLFDRIDKRVDSMINEGLIDEAQSLYPLRHLNSLNTVGYKELFLYFDGKYSLNEAIEKIKRNTRVYAKKQMTWFKKDSSITWLNPENKDSIIKFIDKESAAN